MRGHEAIVSARRSGMKPAMVWLDADGYSPGMARLEKLGCRPVHHVELAANENPIRVDLRFLTGLVVVVSGDNERRVGAVARACRDAGAVRVIAGCSTVTQNGPDVYAHCERMTFDNTELTQWPA